MKLTAIILLAACLQLSAKGLSQTITLTVKDAPLQQVFVAIEKQTDYRFFYNLDILQKTNRVTVNARSLSLKSLLDIIFKNQPVTYTVHGNVITVGSKKNEAGEISVNENKQVIDVRGRVVNERGEPVVASVTVKGTKQGVNTNENGEFHITGVDENSVLVISGVGIETTEIKVSGRTQLNIIAKIVIKPLDEVQMIAYGTTTKRFNTGNVTSVKSTDIEKQPVQNPLLALQGRVPGLFITQNSGVAGGGVTTRIQGQTSISALNGNDPLIVIDGIPYVSQPLSTVSGGIFGVGVLGRSGGPTTGNGNPLSYINPMDIESISILKDADATAIYGSRAANGAILITTKKGKAGVTRVDVNLQQGWGNVAHFAKMLNTTEYLEMRNEAFKNDNVAVGSTDYDLNGLWDSERNTDWQKELIGGTAKYTNISGNVSGGTNTMQYLIGGNFHRETSVFPGTFDDKKGGLHFNINSSSFNQKFKVQLSGSYLIDNNHLPGTDLTANAVGLAPNAPALYDENGELNWAPNSLGVSSWTNPLQYQLASYENKTRNLISSALLSYNILPNLIIKTSMGYTDLETNEFQGEPISYFAPEKRPTATRFALYGNSNITSWSIEPQINFRHSFAQNNFETLIGTSIQQRNSNGSTEIGSGYNSDQLLRDKRSASSLVGSATEASIYKYNALFGRVSYNLQKKYIVNLSARRDGSSRFGTKNQFHNFWSVGAGWLFSTEKFVQNNWHFLSYGKIRGNYGTTGNDQIPDYSYMDLLSSYNPGNPYQGVTGLLITGLPNPYLQWEETKKLQFGLDLGFWNERILMSATVVRNRSSNQLLGYGLPSTTGSVTITENYPAKVQNSAIELELNLVGAKSNNFEWTTSFNLTIPRNKVVSFPGLESSNQANIVVIGQPLGIKKANQFLDVNPTTGIYEFLDKDGNAASTLTLSDAVVLINTLPKLYGGLENNIHYSGVTLDFLFQFVKQTGPDFRFRNIPGRFLSGVNNQPEAVLSRWQKAGDITNVQKFSQNTSLTTAQNQFGSSNANFSDNSFIRLKNVSLSYDYPGLLLKKLKIYSCRLFLQGQNLLTLTHYRGLDPENQSTSVLPPLRTIVFGVQFSL